MIKLISIINLENFKGKLEKQFIDKEKEKIGFLYNFNEISQWNNIGFCIGEFHFFKKDNFIIFYPKNKIISTIFLNDCVTLFEESLIFMQNYKKNENFQYSLVFIPGN